MSALLNVSGSGNSLTISGTVQESGDYVIDLEYGESGIPPRRVEISPDPVDLSYSIEEVVADAVVQVVVYLKKLTSSGDVIKAMESMMRASGAQSWNQ